MTEHADIEALSAYLDGEAPEWTTHIAGCESCGAVVDQLRAVALTVGRPVAAPTDVERDSVIAAALASAPTTPESAPGVPANAVPDAVPLSPRPAAPPKAAARWPSSRVWVAAGSIAAALLAVVGTLALVSRDSDDSETTTALQAPPSMPEAQAAPSAEALMSEGVVDGGHLGELPEDDALAARVRSAVGGAGAQFSDDADSPAAATAPERPDGVGDQGPERPDGAGDVGAPPVAESRNVGTRACEPQARQADPALLRVVYAATGERGGVPVVVLGFALPAGDQPATAAPPLKVMVLAQPRCQLVSQSVVR